MTGYRIQHKMLEIRPQSNIAWHCYAKLSALASVLTVFGFSIGITNLFYLNAIEIIAYNLGVLLLLQLALVPLFLLFLKRESGKCWTVTESGVKISIADSAPIDMEWFAVSEVFVKRYSVSLFHGKDRDEEIVYFITQEQQDQLARFWHAHRSDFPDRAKTAPSDNLPDS